MGETTFYRLPFGHAEVRIDERRPRPPWVAADAMPRQRRRRRWLR